MQTIRHTTGGHFLGEDSNMYRYWHPIEMHKNRIILLIARQRSHIRRQHLKAHTELSSDMQELVFRKNGKVSGRYFYQFLRQGKRVDFMGSIREPEEEI
jgi:hypothetical protein